MHFGSLLRKALWNKYLTTSEQEFSIEIPDKEADKIHSGKHAFEALGLSMNFLSTEADVYRENS